MGRVSEEIPIEKTRRALSISQPNSPFRIFSPFPLWLELFRDDCGIDDASIVQSHREADEIIAIASESNPTASFSVSAFRPFSISVFRNFSLSAFPFPCSLTTSTFALDR
jgi:hypothetical protein